MTRFHVAPASAAILAGLSCAPTSGFGADAGAASETTVKQYLAASDARDVDGMLRTLTDHAVVILPQRAPVKGKDKIAPLLAPFVREFSQRARPHTGPVHGGRLDCRGDILYDKNGGKKGGAILFAKLEGSPDDLSATDFLVI